MNASELLVLAAGLYTHDWGMAVSDSQRDLTLAGRAGEDDFLLVDERERLEAFAQSEDQPLHDLTTWRNYIRQTHAVRSAHRVDQYFSPIDRGLGEAIARTCLGHWLSIEELEDFASFPTDFSTLRENVNLRALAVYVRLIDLFDLADDRTPYVLWKFVAPRDPSARMEWAKHRSLQPVTCPPYLDGRIVRVDGRTNDTEVYAALEDLRGYCEDQLRGCLDVLSKDE